jgi:hypothetical protein
MNKIFVLTMVVSFAWAASAEKDWKGKMSELSTALSDTIPYLYPAPSKDPKALAAKVKKIYDITKTLDNRLDHGVKMPDADPALPYIASLLRRDIERAYQSLQEGHEDYAKGVIRNSVSYCIACHTRTKTGTEFPLIKAFEKPLKKASWIEKIEFQAASRQFDPVLTEVMKELKNKGTAGISSLDLERASRIALSIAVRVKQDPERASMLAQSILDSPSVNPYMKEGAKVWQNDIREWQFEKSKKFKSDQELMLEAHKLLKKVNEADDYPPGGHSEVRLLRASLLMHELLRLYPKSPYIAEAFYVIGLAYDALRDLGLWSLHEMYFLACIDKVPNTPQAMQCYKKYEESITLGYTGSSGVHVPAAVKKHLDSVKAMAQPKGAVK